jgi:hypothetical protein
MAVVTSDRAGLGEALVIRRAQPLSSFNFLEGQRLAL